MKSFFIIFFLKYFFPPYCSLSKSAKRPNVRPFWIFFLSSPIGYCNTMFSSRRLLAIWTAKVESNKIIYMLIGQTPEAAPVPYGRYVTCLWWHHGLHSHYIARARRFLFPGFIEVEWLSNLRPAIFRDAARCTMRLILITKSFSFTLGRAGGIFFSSEIRYPYNRGAKLGGGMTECRSDRDLPREFPLVEFSLCFTESSLLFICVLLSVQVP